MSESETENFAYTPDELAVAQAELDGMPPEQYLQMQEQMVALNSQLSLPEAGGIVWCEVYSPAGVKFNVTARAEHPIGAMTKIVEFLRFAKQAWGFTAIRPGGVQAPQSSPPQTGQVAQAPVQTQFQEEVFDIHEMSKASSPNGQIYLQCKSAPGTKFSKFGAKAWNDVVPDKNWLNNLPHGPVNNWPPAMRKAVYDPNQKKIVRFEQ